MTSFPSTPRDFDGRCSYCRDSGLRVKHQQGDPVPEHPGWQHALTMYETCPCRIVTIAQGKFKPIQGVG